MENEPIRILIGSKRQGVIELRVNPTPSAGSNKVEIEVENTNLNRTPTTADVGQPSIEKDKNEDQDTIQVEDLDEVVDMLNEKLQRLREIFRGEAQFIVDRDVDMIIVKIKDKETGELIRQIPPEVAVRLARNIAEFMGILFDELA